MKQKTKKIILLITSIIALLINLGYAYDINIGAINLEVAGDITNLSNNSQLILLYLCATINLISTFLIGKNFIIHKKSLIVLNIIQFLLGTIFNIIGAIINIYILSSKTIDIEEIKEKKELPVLEDITKHKWYMYLIIFIFLFAICYSPLGSLIPIPETKTASIITMVLLYIIQILFLVIPMKDELKRDFIAFKNNFNLYLSKMLPRFGIIIIFYIFFTLPISSIVGDISTNQAVLYSLPIYLTAFLAIFIGPLTEELMFRGFVKKFIKNDILFIIVSSLIFGALHITTANSLQQLLYIVPYSILGFAFSWNYVKTKNIVSNIFLHSVWNSLAVIVMIIMQFA